MDDSRGIWTSTTDLDLLLRLAGGGSDWLALDAQHGPLDRGHLHPVARGLAAAPVPFLVRVSGVDPEWIGAAGLSRRTAGGGPRRPAPRRCRAR